MIEKLEWAVNREGKEIERKKERKRTVHS